MERNTKDLSNKVNKEQFKKGTDEVIKKQILKLDFDDITLSASESNKFKQYFDFPNRNNNIALTGRLNLYIIHQMLFGQLMVILELIIQD